MRDEPPLADGLHGCAVLPPLLEPKAAVAAGAPSGKAKGKAGHRLARDRFAVLNAFLDFTAGGLSRSELLVWLLLYRDTRGGIAETSQADLARRGEISRRSVGLAIKELERRGLLVVVRRGGINRGASVYRVEPFVRSSRRAQSIAP